MSSYALPLVLMLSLLVPPLATLAASGNEAAAQERKPRKKSRAGEFVFGREGDPRKVKRVIRIDLSDTMRYFPSEIRVKRGDTVRFDLRNIGELPHELVLGTMDDLKKHARLMRHNGEPSHAESHGAHAAPGERTQLLWQFTRAGEFYYACLVPGHFEAGMIGTIVVR
jgi:uncharacterized cupredoxin-like copper-binding protein